MLSLRTSQLIFMLFSSFRIENRRAIRLAECETVPSLMIVAGPNGAGKSTLLNSLREESRQRAIYIGPNRNSRKQQVQKRYLGQQEIDMRNLLTASALPGIEGITIATNQRDTWGSDEVVNYLKFGLCQIETERQQYITEKFDREKTLLEGSVPDIWGPLKELTASLLPHLRFGRIDMSDIQSVKCYWEVHQHGIMVDIDDLSSGEKSIIQMFYPLVEHRIKALLRGLKESEEASVEEGMCVLIDEPELHLHPNLQAKVVDYLRELTSAEDTQVILATHSSTIVEYADFDELYVLRPIELVERGENQLTRLADSEERLKFLRSTFGSTANLTAFQPIVVVEGGDQEQRARKTTDRKLYRALHEGFLRVTIIPGGGKAECLKLRQALSEAMGTYTDKLQVVALLDRDLVSEGGTSEDITYLPVSMIENLFIDPAVIWAAIQSVADKTGLTSMLEVEKALDAILLSFESDEIERRAISALGTLFFRPSSPSATLKEKIDAFLADAASRYSEGSIAKAISDATAEVDAIRLNAARRELFHGKNIIDEFYRKHLHSSGLAKEIFRFLAAKEASKRRSVQDFFNTFLSRFLTASLPEAEPAQESS